MFIYLILAALFQRLVATYDATSRNHIVSQIHRDNKIGAGGFGTVYVVDYGGVDRALKCHRNSDAQSAGIAGREIEILELLTRDATQNAVHIYDRFEIDGFVCYVIDLARHGDLYKAQYMARLVFRHEPTKLERLGRAWARQVIRATLRLHEHSFVYKDVKLDNFLLNDHYDILISDFGLVQHVDELAEGKLGGGTLSAMPQEFFLGEEVFYTADADWFGLGIALHEFFTGKNPFTDKSSSDDRLYRHNIKRGNCYLSLPSEFSEECRQFIIRCLTPQKYRFKDDDILQHPWLADEAETAKILWADVFPDDMPRQRPLPHILSSLRRANRQRSSAAGEQSHDEDDYQHKPAALSDGKRRLRPWRKFTRFRKATVAPKP